MTHSWSLHGAKLEVIPCPLCDSQAFEVLAQNDRYDHGITTVGCAGCGLVMTNPQPTAASLDQFYAEHYRHYYQKVDKPSLAYIREFKKDQRGAATAHFLFEQGAISPGARILDIGASEGAILRALRDVCPNITTTAVEPNPTFREFARNYSSSEVYADLADVPSGERFDLIILNHVFEHLKNPVAYLEGLKVRLSSSGRIYIDVPDLSEYSGLESLHIAHLYHFNARTLRLTLARSGFAEVHLGKHTPVMHPRSLRALLQLPRESVPVVGSDIVANCDDWALVREIDKTAYRYHRRRWPRWKRYAHRLRAYVGFRQKPLNV